MSAKYEIDYSDVSRLEERITKIPNESEKIINKALEDQGVRMVVEEITKLIKTGARPGRHANQSKWETVDNFNLGFDVKSRGGAAKNKGSFGYLVFPDQGRGPRNPIEQRFSERGLDAAEPRVVESLARDIEKKIQEVL